MLLEPDCSSTELLLRRSCAAARGLVRPGYERLADGTDRVLVALIDRGGDRGGEGHLKGRGVRRDVRGDVHLKRLLVRAVTARSATRYDLSLEV